MNLSITNKKYFKAIIITIAVSIFIAQFADYLLRDIIKISYLPARLMYIFMFYPISILVMATIFLVILFKIFKIE